jgi:hypothetical protein
MDTRQTNQSNDYYSLYENISKGITKEQKASLGILGLLKKIYENLTDFFINHMGNQVDILNTIWRLDWVLSDVIQNCDANDSENPDSQFYQTCTSHDQGLSLPPLGEAALELGFAGYIIGALIRIYQWDHEKELRSFAYLMKRVREENLVDPDLSPKEQAQLVKKLGTSFLLRNKVPLTAKQQKIFLDGCEKDDVLDGEYINRLEENKTSKDNFINDFKKKYELDKFTKFSAMFATDDEEKDFFSLLG